MTLPGSEPLAENPYAAPRVDTDARELPPLATRARVARALLFLNAPVLLAGAVYTALVQADVVRMDGGEFDSPRFQIGISLACVTVGLRIATVIAFLIWLHAAYLRAGAGVVDARFTPAASIAWWFVPVANMWMPFLALRHLWQLSRHGAHWRGSAPPVQVAAWWSIWLASVLAGAVAPLLGWLWNPWPLGQVLGFAAPGLAIVAALMAARLVREITAMQHARLGVA